VGNQNPFRRLVNERIKLESPDTAQSQTSVIRGGEGARPSEGKNTQVGESRRKDGKSSSQKKNGAGEKISVISITQKNHFWPIGEKGLRENPLKKAEGRGGL